MSPLGTISNDWSTRKINSRIAIDRLKQFLAQNATGQDRHSALAIAAMISTGDPCAKALTEDEMAALVGGPQIIECEQGSREWFMAKLGIPSASEFATVMAKGEGKTRSLYMRKLAGERITNQPATSFKSAAMFRGNEQEPEARAYYAFMTDTTPQLVGFIRNGRCGCSPDSLIGETGGLEIKTAEPHILIEKIVADKFPPEHAAQVQGNLYVTEREWWDLLVYSPGMPPFIKRSVRDESYIATMAGEIARFNDELDALVERIRRYGEARAA